MPGVSHCWNDYFSTHASVAANNLSTGADYGYPIFKLFAVILLTDVVHLEHSM